MKKAASLILLAALLLAPGWARAVSAPANLALGPYQQNATAFVYWDEDTTVSQWFILLDGKLAYQPLRSQTGLTSTARRSFLMTNIAPGRLPVVVSMQAMAPGQPLSAASAGVTLTSSVPPGGATMVYNDPAFPLFISGSGVSGTSTVNQGLSGASPWLVTGTVGIGISGDAASSYFDKLTTAATASGGWTVLTQTAYTALTPTSVVTLGLTATAGTSSYKELSVLLWVKTGVSAVNAVVHPTATPPGTFASGTGPEFYPSDGEKLVGKAPYRIDNGLTYYLSFVPKELYGAPSGTVWLTILGR